MAIRSLGAPHLMMGLDLIDCFVSDNVSVDQTLVVPVQVQVQVVS
jgi:hypothetical protein